MGNTTHFGIWIASLIILYIMAFIQMYAWFRFNRMRSLVIISKRFPRLVLVEAIAVVITLLVAIPLQQNILYRATNFGFPSHENIIFDKMWTFIVPITHFVELSEITRLYLMSFNLHYLHSSKNEKWKSIIDSTSTSKDWYLQNRNKYGNPKYVCQRMFAYFLFVGISVSVSYWFSLSVGPVVNAVFYLIGVAATVVIYLKCKALGELNDNFLFFYEFRATAIIWALAIFLYFIVVLAQLFGFYAFSNAMGAPVVVLGGCTPSFLSTIWIPHKILSSNQWRMNSKCNATQIAVIIHSPKEERLMDTLKEKEKFELFMQWIYREFSSETALCFIEIVQFKERILQSMESTDVYVRFVGSLYEDIPKSSLVYEENDENGKDVLKMYRKIARKLFEKYIQYNAEFEVNLSAAHRMKYVKLNEENWNIPLIELLNVFDIVAEEMIFFITQSFTRFSTHHRAS